MKHAFIISVCCGITWCCYSQNIVTIAGTGIEGYNGDGANALSCEFDHPVDLTMDGLGNMYIADADNNVVRKIDASGIITTFASVHTADAIICDRNNNVYVASQLEMSVYKITPAGVKTRIAGKGDFVGAYSGDGGPATLASLNYPYGVAVDTTGNVYISTTADGRIRKVNSLGIISTIAGTGGTNHTGDGGPASSAQIAAPGGISLDKNGNLFVTERGGMCVRKINSSGIITTVAGNTSFTNNTPPYGDGGPATSGFIFSPMDVTTDSLGNIYISDLNHLIRKVNTNGIITTVAGNGTQGYSGDGGPATSAQINNPWGIFIDKQGALILVDWYNHRIRKLASTIGVAEYNSESAVSFFPNPTYGIFKVNSSVPLKEIQISNTQGQVLFSQQMSNDGNEVNIESLPSGLYVVRFTLPGATYTKKLVKH
jgi:hypothetical protein